MTFPFSFLVKAKYTYRGRVLTDPVAVLAKHLKAEHALQSFNPVSLGDMDALPSLNDVTTKSISLVSGRSPVVTETSEQTVNQP